MITGPELVLHIPSYCPLRDTHIQLRARHGVQVHWQPFIQHPPGISEWVKGLVQGPDSSVSILPRMGFKPSDQRRRDLTSCGTQHAYVCVCVHDICVPLFSRVFLNELFSVPFYAVASCACTCHSAATPLPTGLRGCTFTHLPRGPALTRMLTRG